MSYNRLFEPGRIGRLTVKNRGVMAPMSTGFSNYDGTASPRLIHYYEERARGGVGMIITEFASVDDVNSIPSNNQLRVSRDIHIASLEQLTEAVHRYGCLVFAQIHHAGNTSNPALTGLQNLSPSDVPAAPGRPAPRPMTLEEIREAVEKFIEAAVRVKKAGYDGVELHGAHSYLIGQFFSPYYNKRTDQYGGNFENRMRFLDEIIDGVRARCGPGFPISVRICGDEMTPDVPDTLTLKDGLAIGRHLEKKGIDVLDISNGSSLNSNANCDPYSYLPGWKRYVAEAFKNELTIPIIATNTIKTPDFAEQLLAEDVCDFVGLGRSQFADAQFMNKAKEGLADEIRNCIGCMYCRERIVALRMPAACAVNPLMGREYCIGEIRKDGEGKPVVVVGGGPGGMETACILAERGFKVILFEKAGELGGTLNLADKPPFKNLITTMANSMKAQLERLGVDIRLNTAATPEIVKSVSPIGVFLASGANPIIPPLPGIWKDNVYTAESVIRGQTKPAGHVVVVGTGLTGLETAEMLGEKGHAVTLVEMQPQVGPGLFAVVLNDVLKRLEQYKPAFLTGHKLISVTEEGIELEKAEDGAKVVVKADSVVLALGVSPDPKVVTEYEAVFEKVYAIGDAGKAGRIAEATRSGYDKAYVFRA